MRFGKIRIEDGNLIFSKHMMLNSLPCKDIIWAYMRREGVEGGQQKQFTTSSLVLITKRRKRYQFDMADREIQECIQKCLIILCIFCRVLCVLFSDMILLALSSGKKGNVPQLLRHCSA